LSNASCRPCKNALGMPLTFDSRSSSETESKRVALGSCEALWTSSMMLVLAWDEVVGG
jgi:hypothetical protein